MQTWVVIFGQGKAKLNPFHYTEFCSLSLSMLLSIWSYHFCYWVRQVIIVLPVKLTNCGGILPSNLLLVLTVPELLSPLWVKCVALWFPRNLKGNKPIHSILATWKQLIDCPDVSATFLSSQMFHFLLHLLPHLFLIPSASLQNWWHL